MLPAEVVELMLRFGEPIEDDSFDLVAHSDHRETLRAAALVCRAWAPVAQMLLPRSVALQCVEDVDAIEAALAANGVLLAQSIRTMLLDGSWCDRTSDEQAAALMTAEWGNVSDDLTDDDGELDDEDDELDDEVAIRARGLRREARELQHEARKRKLRKSRMSAYRRQLERNARETLGVRACRLAAALPRLERIGFSSAATFMRFHRFDDSTVRASRVTLLTVESDRGPLERRDWTYADDVSYEAMEQVMACPAVLDVAVVDLRSLQDGICSIVPGLVRRLRLGDPADRRRGLICMQVSLFAEPALHLVELEVHFQCAHQNSTAAEHVVQGSVPSVAFLFGPDDSSPHLPRLEILIISFPADEVRVDALPPLLQALPATLRTFRFGVNEVSERAADAANRALAIAVLRAFERSLASQLIAPQLASLTLDFGGLGEASGAWFRQPAGIKLEATARRRGLALAIEGV